MSEMRIITKRDCIRGARDRWRNQYKHLSDDKVVGWVNKTAGQIRSDLDALDLEVCSADDVREAIGSGSDWASNICDLCGEDKDVVIQMGDEPDYEARWLYCCKGCLSKAIEKL